MLIYNVTIKVDHSIAKEWLDWLREDHIPAMIDTGCFNHAVILQLRDNAGEDGVTYAVQYYTENETS